MEIEKDEEFSTCSELETTDTKSINDTIEQSKPKNNFIQEINFLKYKTYQEQFVLLFNQYNLEVNSISQLITNYAKSKKDTTEIDYNDYILFSEQLITKIYNIKYFLKENKIDELINEIKSINEKILNDNLLFILHKEKLIYYIKENLVKESLAYAQKNLINLTINNSVLYKKLENVMSLLAYENIKECADKELVNESTNNNNKIEDEIIGLILRFLIKNN